MNQQDKNDMQGFVKQLPDPGITRLAGFLTWLIGKNDTTWLAPLGYENIDDVNSALEIVRNEMSVRNLTADDISGETTKVDAIYNKTVQEISAVPGSEGSVNDYIGDIFYMAMNTKQPGINEDGSMAWDPISAPPLTPEEQAAVDQNASFGTKHGKKVFVALSSVASAALFGALIGPPLANKLFPGDGKGKHKTHRRIVIGSMYVLGVVAGVFISSYAWDKQLAKSLGVMQGGDDDNESMNAAGNLTRSRAIGKRTPSINDPVGTEYTAMEGFKSGFEGIEPVVGGPRPGQHAGPDYWIAAGTALRKTSGQKVFAKNLWWIVTDKGWAPIELLKKA